jgi:hypothetical protein
MKIELTPKTRQPSRNTLHWLGTLSEFLNRYLSDNMVPLFENPRSGDLESHLGNLEYRTRADTKRVAWA